MYLFQFLYSLTIRKIDILYVLEILVLNFGDIFLERLKVLLQ